MTYRRHYGKPRPERDPCACDARCPVCKLKCLAGHAMDPENHWCHNLCVWPRSVG